MPKIVAIENGAWRGGMGEVVTSCAFLSRFLTRDIDIEILSVCLSVGLFVTFRYQMKTA